MSNFCRDCDSLQCKPVGSAPVRPAYQQPTKYDHYSNFQKFKQTKDTEKLNKQLKENLLKLNPKFTDFVLGQEDSIKGQDAVKLNLHLNSLSLSNCTSDHLSRSPRNRDDSTLTSDKEDPENTGKSLEKRKSLLVLARTPVECPISACNRTIGVTFVLSHFLRDHSEDFGVPCQEIYAGKRSVLVFDPTQFDFRENVCLGILAYGGDANDSTTRPTERGLCMSNAFLPQPYEGLTSHLPILIMACRTSWKALLGKTKATVNIHDTNYMDKELLVLWLVSVQTVKPLYSTMTVFDKQMTSSRSSIIKIRDLNNTQNPHDFMLTDTNFMRLSHGELNIFTHERKECIHMEIMINDF